MINKVNDEKIRLLDMLMAGANFKSNTVTF